MSDPGLCECGAPLVWLKGWLLCSATVAKYRALYGEQA